MHKGFAIGFNLGYSLSTFSPSNVVNEKMHTYTSEFYRGYVDSIFITYKRRKRKEQ